MTIRIYNTMAREKQTFQPLQTGRVNMYVCGPTVYDFIHIGNARPLIFFDVVRRYLQSQKFDVTYIVNFTDVDDKLIRKAEQLGCSVPEVANQYIAAFYEDIEQLGVRKADANPRVTENMDEIIDFIKELEERGFAYESAGDVYFRTSSFPDYGKLSQQKLDELQFGIRIEVDERKHDAADFVLWKQAKPGEIYWQSPWGNGRPGWHIECSAMVKKYLGTTIDIHGGGQDLTFPHHECELAQSEAHSGSPLANYWMHNGYIHINNEKMSKSLGNSILVRDIMKRIDTVTLRYFVLSTHYRNPLNFTDDAISQASKSVERIRNSVHNLQHRIQAEEALTAGQQSLNTTHIVDNDIQQKLAQIAANFHDKMNDDFNTADAITAIFDWVSVTNVYLQEETVDLANLHALLRLFTDFNEVIGLYFVHQANENGVFADQQIEQLMLERAEARASKNWARSDEIRQLLADKGIIIEDTPQGVRWRRT
jgi:cysteinyl-tRNA synthetase